MNLQTNHAARCKAVVDFRARHAVQPRLDHRAVRDDAELVPFAVFADGTPLFGKRQALLAFLAAGREQPAAPRLVVNAAAPHPPARHIHVNLALVAVDPIRRELVFLAGDDGVCRVGKNFAADLHAGIKERVALVFQFQFKIFKRLRGAKKTVAGFGNGLAREHAVGHGVFGLAAVLLPAVEIFAVEQVHPAVLRENGRSRQDGCRDDG